jgi:hypothetical protein
MQKNRFNRRWLNTTSATKGCSQELPGSLSAVSEAELELAAELSLPFPRRRPQPDHRCFLDVGASPARLAAQGRVEDVPYHPPDHAWFRRLGRLRLTVLAAGTDLTASQQTGVSRKMSNVTKLDLLQAGGRMFAHCSGICRSEWCFALQNMANLAAFSRWPSPLHVLTSHQAEPAGLTNPCRRNRQIYWKGGSESG